MYTKLQVEFQLLATDDSIFSHTSDPDYWRIIVILQLMFNLNFYPLS